jgi:hypothetical protein
MFAPLNFPEFNYRIRPVAKGVEIWDILRKKYVRLTPEEWVRQHVINYLIHYKQYPQGLISVEKVLNYHQQERRTDIVAHNTQAKPCLLIECKAPEITLSDKTIEQSAIYNTKLKAPFVLITNGIKHYCFRFDFQLGKSSSVGYIPDFDEISKIIDED